MNRMIIIAKMPRKTQKSAIFFQPPLFFKKSMDFLHYFFYFQKKEEKKGCFKISELNKSVRFQNR